MTKVCGPTCEGFRGEWDGESVEQALFCANHCSPGPALDCDWHCGKCSAVDQCPCQHAELRPLGWREAFDHWRAHYRDALERAGIVKRRYPKILSRLCAICGQAIYPRYTYCRKHGQQVRRLREKGYSEEQAVGMVREREACVVSAFMS